MIEWVVTDDIFMKRDLNLGRFKRVIFILPWLLLENCYVPTKKLSFSEKYKIWFYFTFGMIASTLFHFHFRFQISGKSFGTSLGIIATIRMKNELKLN